MTKPIKVQIQVDKPTYATFAGNNPNITHIKKIRSKDVMILAILLKYKVLVIKVATLYTVLIKVMIKFAKIKKNKYLTEVINSTGTLSSFSTFKMAGTATTKITGIMDRFATKTEVKYSLASFLFPL